MRVAIVGCGLIGHKRAKALGDQLGWSRAPTPIRAEQLAVAPQYPGCDAAPTGARLVASWPTSTCVIVATTNDALAPVTLAAVQAGKHVLVEKPRRRTRRSWSRSSPGAEAGRRRRQGRLQPPLSPGASQARARSSMSGASAR